VRRFTQVLIVALATVGTSVIAPIGMASATAGPEQVAPASHGYCTTWSGFRVATNRVEWLPTIGAGGTSHCRMVIGSQGNGVRALQNALRLCYGLSVAVDGDFGTQTRNALIAVQRWEGIVVDGIYGPQTRDNILWPRYYDNGAYAGYCG
jgi:hypothetical protein